MDDIRQALARGYCSKENENKELDSVLIEAMTKEVIALYDEVYIINKMKQMSEESLSPEAFEFWEVIKEQLIGNRKALNSLRSFICPDCKIGYQKYFDGADCSCGTIHLCSNCYIIEHKKHDGEEK